MIKKTLLFLLTIVVVIAIVLRVRYGGGEPYIDLTSAPTITNDSLEVVLEYRKPIGNVAVSRSGRVFFTVHPESRPKGNKLLEHIDGASVPFPNIRRQAELFDTPLGIAIDKFDRLWTIDNGNHGTRQPRLLAFDLETGNVVHDNKLPPEIAPAGSFLQDLQISADGRTVIIADASFWLKRPAIIVYDVESASARRVLESHPVVSAENFVINNSGHKMTFLGGLVVLRGGVDGIALNPDWLYFAAINGSGLYRVPLRDLRDEELPKSQLARRVEHYSAKPLSDGLSVDIEGNIYLTDIEHNAIFVVGEDREPVTLIRSANIRWPDALSFGPDGWLYVADSALGDVILQSQDHIQSRGPYRIFRFRPGTAGIPGQ
jgi:sugar lactone lactonase YvrE